RGGAVRSAQPRRNHGPGARPRTARPTAGPGLHPHRTSCPRDDRKKENRKKRRSDSMKVLEGVFTGQGRKIALVASRFNELVVSKLVEGARDCLVRHGVSDD